MWQDVLDEAVALRAKGEPFALATVVAARPPQSARPGFKAIIHQDGSLKGWVGGSCARPTVLKEALKALEDGRPRLLCLSPEPGPPSLTRRRPPGWAHGRGQVAAPFTGPQEGVIEAPMTCQSQGALEVYIEPFLPRPQLLIIGSTPVAQALARLGKLLEFQVWGSDPAATQADFPDADLLLDGLEGVASRLSPQSHVVVATHGEYDEEALAAVAGSEAGYIGLVASPRRGRAALQYLKEKGVPPERLAKVKCPAGLDLGALTPAEVALTIAAEILQRRRQAVGEALEAPEAIATGDAVDPVCGMTVAVATARYTSSYGEVAFYFCCLPCKESFDREPERYALAARA
ncbi:MAG TPA: XdhC family protein [Dehalococcoidia bacterium]|nr:XdhC family protein [Dehalococcoidia bacterium]